MAAQDRPRGLGNYEVGTATELGLAVSRGEFRNLVPIHKFGHNHLVGTTVEDIWGFGGRYIYPPAATIMTVSSDDAADTNQTGVGAWKVSVQGLDTNFDEISEDVLLEGLTPVSTTKEYRRIHRLEIEDANQTDPENAENVGVIYVGTGAVTLGVPANVYGQIDVGYNQSLMALYTIPRGHKGYFKYLFASSDTQKSTDIEIRVREPNGVFKIKNEFHFFQNMVDKYFDPPLIFSEMSDIAIRGQVDVGNANLSSDFILICEKLPEAA